MISLRHSSEAPKPRKRPHVGLLVNSTSRVRSSSHPRQRTRHGNGKAIWEMNPLFQVFNWKFTEQILCTCLYARIIRITMSFLQVRVYFYRVLKEPSQYWVRKATLKAEVTLAITTEWICRREYDFKSLERSTLVNLGWSFFFFFS